MALNMSFYQEETLLKRQFRAYKLLLLRLHEALTEAMQLSDELKKHTFIVEILKACINTITN